MLLGTYERAQIRDPILAIEFVLDITAQVRHVIVQRASFNDNVASHNVKLGEQAGAAVTTEEVVIVVSRSTNSIEYLGRSYSQVNNDPRADSQ